MIWKLTDKVWWGNAEALSEVYAQGVRCVLAVGGNIADKPLGCTPLGVDEKIPYLRVAWPDHEPPPAEYLGLLLDVVGVVRRLELFPLLVHCRAGQMRSPLVAAIATHQVHGGEFADILAEVRRLRPDVMRDAGKTKLKPYCAAILEQYERQL